MARTGRSTRLRSDELRPRSRWPQEPRSGVDTLAHRRGPQDLRACGNPRALATPRQNARSRSRYFFSAAMLDMSTMLQLSSSLRSSTAVSMRANVSVPLPASRVTVTG